MAKQHLSRDEKLLMKGRLEGIQQTMVLLDKFGWHINEETPDSRDTDCVVETTMKEGLNAATSKKCWPTSTRCFLSKGE